MHCVDRFRIKFEERFDELGMFFEFQPLDNFTHGIWENPFALMHQMDRHIQDIRERMGSMDVPSTGSVSDFLKDAYEIGEDGKVSPC